MYDIFEILEADFSSYSGSSEAINEIGNIKKLSTYQQETLII